MLKIENTEVLGWEHAIRGVRNPMNSWEKSDSGFCHRDLFRDCTTCVHFDNPDYPPCKSGGFDIGPNDYDLMTRLRNAGTDHRKFMRMIAVYVDLTGPLYWWKEFDTYKVGTVANSCSTMHKIAAKEFTLEDFSCEHLIGRYGDGLIRENSPLGHLRETVGWLNDYREIYLNGGMADKGDGTVICYPPKDKDIWWQMIQLLPSSYNQRRTVMLNYEVLANIYKSRRNHKLDEWHTFCDWVESLPYSELITGPSIKEIPISHEIMEEAKRRVRKEMED